MVTSDHVTKTRSDHSIRRIRKPHAARKFHGSIFYRTGVIAEQSFTLREQGISRIFCSFDLDLEPIIFIQELDWYDGGISSRYTRRVK